MLELEFLIVLYIILKLKGLLIVENNGKDKFYSGNMTCPKCDISFEELQPRMFSFNSPFGACEGCHGLGIKMIFDEDLIIPDKELSIIDGAIKIYGKIDMSWRGQQLQAVGKKFGFDIYTPIKKFNEKQIQTLFYGSTEAIKGKWDTGANMNFENGWEGLIPQSERLYKAKNISG